MKADEMLKLTDEDLEAMRDKETIELGTYIGYMAGLVGLALGSGETLESTIEKSVLINNEHVVFYIKAYQELKRRQKEKNIETLKELLDDIIVNPPD